jgi:hypothetical protein
MEHDDPIHTVDLPTGRLKLYTRWVIELPDGSVNHFKLSDVIHQPEYLAVAAWAGYLDPVRYAWEHDVTHCWLAVFLGKDWSEALRRGADGLHVLAEAPKSVHDEEHLVNHLQRQLRTGEPDPWGRLQLLFGPALPLALVSLEDTLRTSWPVSSG